ncbi:MAG: DNA mismatch endonuclease Vsr [Acidobacteriia bacterium]|nr:DNA mismatch endonuclease Vsr [Terriglobia bacterium]
MTDKLSKELRSANMRAVRSRNTRPEIRVRQIAHSLGYRFRLHRRDLPGKPDIVFPGRQKAVFVHGCFWHQHHGCRRASIPQSNVRFWHTKLARNAARDAKQLAAIRKCGWRALVVWECEVKDVKRLTARLRRFLSR